jgi:hypothetical protein
VFKSVAGLVTEWKLLQIGATVNHYFTAPELFKAAVIAQFEDKFASYRFAAAPIEFELYGDASAVQFWVVPTTVGEYKLTSGDVPATNLNNARFQVVQSKAQLSNPANVKSGPVQGACPAPAKPGAPAARSADPPGAAAAPAASSSLGLNAAVSVASGLGAMLWMLW